MTDLKWTLAALVIVGAVPLLVAGYQFLLIGLHFRRLHYDRCAPLRHADASWDKTEKTGKVAISA